MACYLALVAFVTQGGLMLASYCFHSRSEAILTRWGMTLDEAGVRYCVEQGFSVLNRLERVIACV